MTDSEIKNPTQAEFEVTHQCNFNCVHCCVKPRLRESYDMGLMDIAGVFRNLADAGVLHLTLTGGEPFKRNDFNGIVAMAREFRFSVSIITNGSLIDDMTAGLIAEDSPTRVEVSIYGGCEETYEAVTRKKGMFDRVRRGIDMLVKNELPVELKYPVLKENIRDVEAAAEFAGERNLGIKFTPLMTCAYNGSRAPLKHAVTPDEACGLIEEGIIQPPGQRHSGDVLCPAGLDNPAIGPDGTLYPCLEIRTPVEELPSDDFTDIWLNSEVLKDVRERASKTPARCMECEHLSYCSVCPGALAREGIEKGPAWLCGVMDAAAGRGLVRK